MLPVCPIKHDFSHSRREDEYGHGQDNREIHRFAHRAPVLYIIPLASDLSRIQGATH